MSSPLLPASTVHLPEELLEEYSFGRVCGPALERLEEHLFVCADCQDRLSEVEAYIALMKRATDAWERDRSGVKSRFRIGLPHGRRALTGAALAAGVTGVLLLGGYSSSFVTPPGSTTVKLTAMRGSEIDVLAAAPAGKALDLRLDRNGLPPVVGYRLEMVTQEGRKIWSGVPQSDGASLSAHVTPPPTAGLYWIRLYSEAGELLREFGMRVQ